MGAFARISKNYTNLETSKIILILVPYEKTSTWGKGSNKGPQAFLKASNNMELYDIETNSEVYRRGIFLINLLTKKNTPKEMIEKVYNITYKYLLQDKFVTLFGGEHSISIGSIRAFGNNFSNINILQLDAHTDLRPTYQGDPYNHACSLYEASQKYPLIQWGIRSMDIEEKKYIQPHHIFYANDIYYKYDTSVQKALNVLLSPVYITIDLDVFDPSIVPSTGTPEPGGLLWYSTLKFLRKVFEEKKVVGFDIVELSPNKNEKSSAFLSAKLYYKLLSYQFEL